VRLFLDMFSAQYLNGVNIDYVTGVMGSDSRSITRTLPEAVAAARRLLRNSSKSRQTKMSVSREKGAVRNCEARYV